MSRPKRREWLPRSKAGWFYRFLIWWGDKPGGYRADALVLYGFPFGRGWDEGSEGSHAG